MTTNDFSATIAVLERRLAEHERKAQELRSTINLLCEEAGQAPKYVDVTAGTSQFGGGQLLTQLKRDSFYGKKQMTAIREYLEMRRSQGDGPATPQEILEALKLGGYKFETKSDDIALVGIRALLRKATTVFHKLPGTRTYGLLSWYPGAKPSKDDDDKPTARKTVKTKKRVTPSPRKTKDSGSPVAEPATERTDDE